MFVIAVNCISGARRFHRYATGAFGCSDPACCSDFDNPAWRNQHCVRAATSEHVAQALQFESVAAAQAWLQAQSNYALVPAQVVAA